MLRSVGSGTGPETLAPVRSAVSTISRAARSMASWSYAFSLIRIFCAAIAATSESVSLLRLSFSRGSDDPRIKGGPHFVGRRPRSYVFAVVFAAHRGRQKGEPAARPYGASTR